MLETRVCQNCKNSFTIEPEDFLFYEKISVPPPTFCPECRLIRRLAWRNEKSLYRRSCDKCKKDIISVFHRDSGLTVYCSACWWSDDWDAMSYGFDYDPRVPFLIQLHNLFRKVPVMNLFAYYNTLESSDYTNMVGYLKNCYLITNSDHDENCSYGSDIVKSKDSIDNMMLTKGELCYETVNCRDCNRVIYSLNCESCLNVAFSRNCIGCSDVIGCVNLRNKKYCIFNQQYSREEYEKVAVKYLTNSNESIEKLKKECLSFWNKFPNKYIHERHNVNVKGDYLFNSKNVKDSFIVTDTEDSRYCSLLTVPKSANCYDFTHYGENCELVYETMQAGDMISRIYFSWFAARSCHDIEYSQFVTWSNNIFGSVGLRNKEFCILNKQYSKDDYKKLRLEIIEDMNKSPYFDKLGRNYGYGEFFPVELSPFGYNETSAHDTFPLNKEEAMEKGYKWRDQEKRNYDITLKNEQIPDSISDVRDSILNEIIECQHQGKCNENCTEAFRIIPQELAFLRRQNIALPRLCSNCRHYQRLKNRNPWKLWHRVCMCEIKNHGHEGKCQNEFETSYAPERPEIVYCEACYNREVA
ncbi:hypothetical protein A2Z63_01785 [Candidatus Giovannonibacteria bacterium RIFCSPLOWO2_02_44_8]|uniref:Uncharacterized protein n=2 Tax=Candidatus Giovannoniibacteriota TaxID=1752738 RepID=A0A1F5XCE0_9BACT|nr:MAG: hypothetical protein A2Z63_01785 [Candidatus Giovannonibacteria bacterium RIFCSPLOWO2_02_44_8]OGF95634.1 MAG: hypothetical protein A2Y47_02860 [Candidatus Giovannonibacteria bacterium RIFCSPLOWO2_12_43_8]